MEHSQASHSSGPMSQHYRSSSNIPYRLSGMHVASGVSSTSLLGASINEHPAPEAVVSNGVTAPLTLESPVGGDGSATMHTNASTWGSNTHGEDGDAALPPIGGMHPPLRDPSPLSIHRNIDSVRRGSGLRNSPNSSVLQSPTIQNTAGTGGGAAPSSLSGASSTVPSGASALSYTHRSKSAMASSVVVCGPAGIGKSSLILANQTNWRSSGLWGYAKMVKGESSPFTGLVRRCASLLSSSLTDCIADWCFTNSAVLSFFGSSPADGFPLRPAHFRSIASITTRSADDQRPTLVPRSARAEGYPRVFPHQLR